MEDRNYKPSLEAKEFLEEANELDKKFAPLPPGFYRRPTTRNKRKKKQLKIEKAISNMTKPPTNFQGVPLDKCTFIPELDTSVFMHDNYQKAWRKRQKEPHFFATATDGQYCRDCYLQPCSARLLENKLEFDACTMKDLAEMTEEEYKEKLRLYYRAQLATLQGKRIINHQMPTNNDIPLCAKKLTAKIASIEAGGYDSLFDEPNPFPSSLKPTNAATTNMQGEGYMSESSEEEACFE